MRRISPAFGYISRGGRTVAQGTADGRRGVECRHGVHELSFSRKACSGFRLKSSITEGSIFDLETATATARRSLEGLALGDAFGELYCHLYPRFTPESDLPPGRWAWTDDTRMAIFGPDFYGFLSASSWCPALRSSSAPSSIWNVILNVRLAVASQMAFVPWIFFTLRPGYFKSSAIRRTTFLTRC